MTSRMFIGAAALPFLSLLILACPLADAGTITLTFNVNVWDTFNYATMANDLQGFNTTMTVTFDGAVTSVEQDTNDTLVFFGTPTINSPLTATLPYGPAPGQPPESREVVLANRDYGPSQQWSEFTIVQDQETESGATTWAYDFELDSGSQSLYPLIANLLDDSSTALYQQLLVYQQNQAPLVFDETADQFDSQTGQALAGLGYRATAYLVDIQETPEPSTFAFLGGAALVFTLKRRFNRNINRRT